MAADTLSGSSSAKSESKNVPYWNIFGILNFTEHSVIYRVFQKRWALS
jgi:abortive infection bacteriophage resistance protein